MKKNASVFFCQECGYESAKWLGQCPACHEWNTFAEEPKVNTSRGKMASSGRRAEAKEPVSLKHIDSDSQDRISTGMAELDLAHRDISVNKVAKYNDEMGMLARSALVLKEELSTMAKALMDNSSKLDDASVSLKDSIETVSYTHLTLPTILLV